MKQEIVTDAAPKPAAAAYSQGLVAGPFVFVAGQGPKNPETGVIPGGIEQQTHQVLRNIRAILSASHVSMDDVVKVTAHLADLEDFERFNSVYAGYFDEPRPVRTTVGSRLNGIMVEIDVIAYRG